MCPNQRPECNLAKENGSKASLLVWPSTLMYPEAVTRANKIGIF